MRKLILILLALVLSVAAALWLNQQGGFVLVSLGEWTLQTSVLLFVGAVIAFIIGLYLLINLIRELLGVPRRVRRWAGNRRQRRARTGLIEGLIRLAEGRHAEAEKLLLKHIDRSEAPLLHYLGAAVAAQRRGSYEDRDRFLGLADRTSPRARLAVGLIQAQLQVDAGQWEQAFATLTYLQEQAPRNPRVLTMLLKCCLALDEWERVHALLPELRKQGVVSEERAEALARQVAEHRLQQARREGLVPLEKVWGSLGKSLREDPALVLSYIEGQVEFGNADEAERLLRQRLQKEWDGELARRYGALAVSAPERSLAQIEKWLKERPEDAVLLHAAGRQALRAQLWGRARTYFEAAVGRAPRAESYHALGALLERTGEPEAAREAYRKALDLTVADQGAAALTEGERGLLAAALPRSEAPEA